MKVGVVVLPMILGDGKSTQAYCDRLLEGGYLVERVDIYKFQRVKPPQVPFVFMGGERKKINAVAEGFDFGSSNSRVGDALVGLERGGATRFALVGFGMGAIIALHYMTCDMAHPLSTMFKVGLVAGWYPHLKFPEGSRHTTPDVRKVPCPVLLFFGQSDSKVEPGNLELARSMVPPQRQHRVVSYPGVEHAFAYPTLKGVLGIEFPNPLYSDWAAKNSWSRTMAALDELRNAQIGIPHGLGDL